MPRQVSPQSLKYFVLDSLVKVEKSVTENQSSIGLITTQDLLIPPEAYYELPTGVQIKMVGEVSPVFFSLRFVDNTISWRLVNQSPIVWPSNKKLVEVVLQLWNPGHQSYAIPEDSLLGELIVYRSVKWEEVLA